LTRPKELRSHESTFRTGDPDGTGANEAKDFYVLSAEQFNFFNELEAKHAALVEALKAVDVNV